MTQITEEEIIQINRVKPMTAFEFLLSMCPSLPMSIETPCIAASNSEVRRWLEQSAVIINGVKPKPKDIITFPVTSLIFFPKSKPVLDGEGKVIKLSRKTTVI